MGTDSQPNALIIALCLFPFCCKWKMNKNLTLLLLLAIIAFILLFISPLNFGSIRSLVNYISLFVITYVTYFSLKKIRGIPYSLFKAIIWIWFLVGTIQLFINPDFMSFLIPRGNSAHTLETGRGIVCLAPEPTFYGITCLFLVLFTHLNFKNEPKVNRLYLLLGIQILLYSRSSLAIFILLVSVGLYFALNFFNKKYFFKIIVVLILISFTIFIILNKYSDQISTYRVGKLLSLAVESPQTVLLLDASTNERFVHIFFPIYGCLENYFLPHGYEDFQYFMEKCFNTKKFSDLFTPYLLSNPIIRIMSGWGSLFYELGAFGLLLIIVFYNSISSVYQGKTRIMILAIIGMLLMNAIPFSNPIIPFYIGNLLYKKETMNHESYN